MAWFLYFFSVALISVGACAILYTEETHRVWATLLSRANRKMLSALPFGVGILLFISASASSLPWLVRLFGLISLIKGVVVYLNPNASYDRLIHWYTGSVSQQGDKLLGIISIIFGTAVLSWIA